MNLRDRGVSLMMLDHVTNLPGRDPVAHSCNSQDTYSVARFQDSRFKKFLLSKVQAS